MQVVTSPRNQPTTRCFQANNLGRRALCATDATVTQSVTHISQYRTVGRYFTATSATDQQARKSV